MLVVRICLPLWALAATFIGEQLDSAKSPSGPNPRSVLPSNDATDVRLGEIIALEQEGLTRGASQCVREHFAEIEAGGVTSFPEAAVRPSRFRHLLRIDGDSTTSALWISTSSSCLSLAKIGSRQLSVEFRPKRATSPTR
jgi:hypothetical protein